MPPLHPYCYCSTAPVEPDEAILSKESIDDDFEKQWQKALNGDKEARAHFEKLYENTKTPDWKQFKLEDAKETKTDFMGRPERFAVGGGFDDIKAYQYKDNSRYWIQSYNTNTQKVVEFLDKNLERYEKQFGKLDDIVIATEKKFPGGIAAYQQKNNLMFLCDSLGDDEAVAKFLADGRFPAKNQDDILTHEFAHKKHWDAVKQFYNVQPSRYNSLEDAKNEFDTPIRKFIATQITSDPLYVKKTVSGNAQNAYDDGSINEFIADAVVLMKNQMLMEDAIKLLKEVLGL